MPPEYSRREWLGLLGAASVGSVAISGRAGAECGSVEDLQAELDAERERLVELEAEYDEFQANTAALAAEIEGIEERLVRERARYPADVRIAPRKPGCRSATASCSSTWTMATGREERRPAGSSNPISS